MEGARLVDGGPGASSQEAAGAAPADGPPLRIVSLLPEATDILTALGLADQMVLAPRADGPPAATWEPRDCPSVHALAAARPALIFTSETGAGGGVSRSLVRRLVAQSRPRPSVFALEPHTIGDILSDIKTVGDATGQQEAARALIVALRTRIDRVTLRAAHLHAAGLAPRVACLAGTTPDGDPVAAGWWLAELVGLAGGLDVLAGAGRPPRPVRWPDVAAARPEQVWMVGLPIAPPHAARTAWPAGGMPRWLAAPVAPPGPAAVAALSQFAAWAGPECADDPAEPPGQSSG